MPVQVGIENSEFYTYLVRELRAFDKTLAKHLSKRISAGAKPVVSDMRQQVKGLRSDARFEGFSGGSRPTRTRGGSGARARSDFATRNATRNAAEAVTSGKRLLTQRTWDRRRMQARSLRASIAAGVRLVNRTTGRGAGVMIRTSASRLPPDQKALPRAMDRGKWRHPFFGNRDYWIEQTARPAGWFTKTAQKAKPKLYREVTRAVDDAVLELAKRGRQ